MATMTVGDVVTRVQRQFGDESGVQVTNADIIRWINDCARETVSQHENLFQNFATTVAVVNQMDYALASNLITIQSISYKDVGQNSFYPLRWVAPKEMSEYFAGWDGTDYPSDVPLVFTRSTASGFFTVFPAPQSAGTFKVVGSAYSTNIDDVNDVLPLPEYYHQMVLEYCLMKAYEMDEDWEAADKKAAYVQSTLDFHNNHEAWFGRETYPSIVPTSEDYFD